MKRNVFMISDGTGITVELLSNSLITQFEGIEFEKQIFPYIDSLIKAEPLHARINQCFEETKIKPIVFMTLVNPQISAYLSGTNACVFDLFNTFLSPLEKELETKSSDTVGRAHSMSDSARYDQRIEAINYALTYDDGVKTKGYENADIILIGVSRCGKTPTCLYMALQFGIFAANYPFTEEDLSDNTLPVSLRPHLSKLFGLTIDAKRLQNIRTERRPNSQYSSIDQCRQEITKVERMYQKGSIPYINSTSFSVEEIATKIMAIAKLKRKI